VKFSLREIRKVFPNKFRNLKLWKKPKLLNFRLPEGRYFLNCDNTELKRSSEINFPVAERHRWAVVGSIIPCSWEIFIAISQVFNNLSTSFQDAKRFKVN